MRKKITGGVLAVLLSSMLAMTVLASPLDNLKEMLQSLVGVSPESVDEATASLSNAEAEQLIKQLEALLGESAPTEANGASETPAPQPETTLAQPETPAAGPQGAPASEGGESQGESAEGQGGDSAGAPADSQGGPGGPEGDSPAGESGGEQGAAQEPESPGIPKDEPVSTTGTAYGYTGTFDIDTASSEQVNLNEGEWDINNAQMIFWGGTAIQNAGTSSLAVRDSFVRGETAVETAPLSGPPGGLLVSGNIRTTLGVGNSESIYVNSTIVSRNWAALSTDAAQPAPEGGKELSLYAYGSEAITMDGGYGAYSDLFCNLFAYGSHFQAAEIGIISGTYGKVTVGNIADGEKDPVVSKVLTKADKEKRSDKELPSIIEGGRNALMIHSVNLPPYWEYEGYSEEQIPLYKTDVRVHGSTLRTDLSLDKGVEYEPQQQAYIDHTKGSVILVKSTNADLYLEDCEIVPDPKGTGYLIQTVYNNDTMFMNAVPEGKTYPGVIVTVKDCDLSGGIVNEDYQRDLLLTLAGSTLTGYMNEYDCAHWNEVSAAEGFTDYCKDSSYSTHHGIMATLQSGSSWTVTQESHLSKLVFTEDSKVIGLIFVDGVEQKHEPGKVYEGNVVVKPGVPEEETTSQEETTTEHIHNWASNGGSPADCEHDGVHVWICTTCGAEYQEPLTALGHKWILSDELSDPATCEKNGTNLYTCERCGEFYSETVPATGHLWHPDSIIPATCETPGEEKYTCVNCGLTQTSVIPATGHDWVWDLDHSVWPTCDTDGTYAYICNNEGCTATFTSVWPATGHDWEIDSYTAPDCENDGVEVDKCTVCGATQTITFAAYGHNWVYQNTVAADCLNSGYDVYTCSECGVTDYFNFVPAEGHSYTCYPTPGNETMTHTYYCTTCGDSYTEYHTTSDPCICGYSGPRG